MLEKKASNLALEVSSFEAVGDAVRPKFAILFIYQENALANRSTLVAQWSASLLFAQGDPGSNPGEGIIFKIFFSLFSLFSQLSL